ncbi:MAG: 3-deoxy-manno-octulosonate cytidylyltransferase [Epsilonproteobacteria bacterium]|nr:3-deoxy-manno-octulosonate cytidylyltransferase [Campylobacterota bacterium]MBD3839684.1 3-deoxy-manno-octulosonate cytidylyltransferase [Campylobacterota bacterium]
MIIIPARIGSTRFANKVLADIDGLPMVIKTAKAVSVVDRVAIATDSLEVLDIASTFGIEAVLTSNEHKSGTDRINEASHKLSLSSNEIILNVQADEPFIEPEVVYALFELTKKNISNPKIMINSCYKDITHPEADDPNLVKVVTDIDEVAIYFSRAKIPYPRDHHFDGYKGHIGLYGFSKEMLNRFCQLPLSPLEEIEKLEQLRAIYSGYGVAMVKVETQSFGIDTLEDLEKAKRLYIN